MIQTPISVGELIDKLSILHIKQGKLLDTVKLEYVNKEFEILYNLSSIYLNDETIQRLYHELVEVNTSLWNIEDKLRELESLKDFNSLFIELARKVYYTNDKRFEIKNQINNLSNSEIREQKSYQEYNDINGDISEEKRFIYESPDGGKTIFKREFGKPHETREKITNE